MMQLLYSGPYSRVYKENQYAVKIIDRDFKILPHDYLREIKILQQLHHANIVEVIDIKYKFDDVLIYMPYYANNLLNYIQENRTTKTRFGPDGGVKFTSVLNIPQKVIHNILTQVIDSIHYLHQQHIIHRDIKPGNYLLDTKGDNQRDLTVVLCDFSILVPESENDLIHDICSGYYKPLEVIFGLDYGFGVDVWGLGIMILMLYSTNGNTVLGNCKAESTASHPESQSCTEEITDFLLIDKIFHTFGTPTTEPNNCNYWPDIFTIDNFRLINLPTIARSSPQQLFPNCKNPKMAELFNNICHLNPQLRPDMGQISHTWNQISK